MKVRTVGYYKEMPHGGKSILSIYDYINKESADIVDKVCEYLESGIIFISSPEIVNDIIKPENGFAGSVSTYTDGEWLWPGDLAYYVKKYQLKLPDEFIATMKRNNWKNEKTFSDINYDVIEVDGSVLK